jgi:hypothetical protein
MAILFVSWSAGFSRRVLGEPRGNTPAKASAPLKCFVVGALVSLGALAISPAAPAPTAEQMMALIKNRPEIDEIRWKDPARGAPLKVRIISSTAQAVVVEKVLPTGPTTRTVPLGELSGIDFSLTPRELALHQQPDADAVPALKVLWESRQATLKLAGASVAQTGLALAKSLRMSGEISSLDEAGKILDQIRGQDAPAAQKDLARTEQATIDFVRAAKSGKPADTDKLAWKITEDADNPDGMLLATAFLADRHFADLKSTEAENPRWMDDDAVKPLRNRLYNLALDFALYPSLFLGSHQKESAAGLKKAAEIYQFTNENVLAKGALEDIAALYPETETAKETAPLLAKLKAAAATGDLEKMISEPPAEKKPDEADNKDAPATGAPPPPRRYNIFGE